MRRLAIAVSFLLIFGSFAAAHGETPALGDTSWLLVEVSHPAKMIGYPAGCPGSSPEENQDEICLAELYQARVRVLRDFASGKASGNLTVRFTAHSFHAVWRKGVRFIVQLRPFEDKDKKGQFASFWDWEDKRGMFCRADREIKDSNFPPPVRKLFEAAPLRKLNRSTEEWSEGAEVRCITGRERLATPHG